MLIFNLRGLAMCAVAFGIAFGCGRLFGFTAEGPLMAIAGPLVVAFDLGLRWRTKQEKWLVSPGGGRLFFLPAWCFGALWFVLGVVYTLRGHEPPSP